MEEDELVDRVRAGTALGEAGLGNCFTPEVGPAVSRNIASASCTDSGEPDDRRLDDLNVLGVVPKELSIFTVRTSLLRTFGPWCSVCREV